MSTDDRAPLPQPGSGRRQFKNLFLAPEKQIRLGFWSFAFAFLCVSALFAIVLIRFNQILDALVLLARDPSLAFDAATHAKRVLWQTYGVLVLSFLAFTAALVVRISHRYLGPMVAIRRQLRAMREGRFEARVTLRRNDEFADVAEDLNALAERLGTNQGFSVVEMLIGMSVAMAMILAVASLQNNITNENRALSQKLEFAEFNRALSQVMSDDNVCTCNTKGANLAANSDGSFYADITHPLYSGFSDMTSCAGSGTVLASPGSPLPNTRYQMPVAKIQVLNMAKQGTDASSGLDVYTGYVGVIVADPPGATDKKVVRTLAPASVGKKFYVSGSTIQACGQAANEIDHAYADNWQTNDVDADPVSGQSTAHCPAGMFAIGGGWITQAGAAPPPGCKFKYSVALASQPDMTYQSWSVMLLCETYKAFVSCYRPSFQ